MIVRIQQFDATDAERFAGWADLGAVGAIRCAWPTEVNAYELSVLETDEQQQPVAPEQRRLRLRALVAPLAEALREEKHSIVARLDGPIAPGELLSAFPHLTDPHGGGRFAVSAAEKLDPQPVPAAGGLRIELTRDGLDALCTDPFVGIDRNVRLRVFALPAVMVNPLLDTADLDDERWPELLPQVGFVMQNTHGLDALQVLTSRPAEEVSRIVTEVLGGGSVQSSIRSPR